MKTKYEDVLTQFWKQLPSGTDEVANLEKVYPDYPDEITLLSMMSKLKAIRWKYRQALDPFKKGGHSKVIICYFDLCNRIWD